ncbi:hypothetical protein AXF42_Ash005933 [Apostasia shenzhenica]|uniref:Uncharacterized protein n=1 Tax=Apostasia shenzhenica TaxID=1088818 RepID=A0A2I0AZR1_9ASPA|nr:hypothetical protein AXF42_Ash005933 [Apostasia shenzhenica]
MSPSQALSDEVEGNTEASVKTEPLETDKNDLVVQGTENGACANTNEDGRSGDVSLGAAAPMDQEVDILGCEEDEVSTVIVKNEGCDATEQSSSFGDTFSGSDGGLNANNYSDMEVESPLNLDQRAFNGPVRLFKKKRVSSTWRKLISPIMWRCRWLELRMTELQSQASRYDKELAAYKHEKQMQSNMIELNDCGSRSVPLTCRSCRKPHMKRRRRRRTEDDIDISSYMSNHNIFSYYENKRCETDGHSVDDDISNQGKGTVFMFQFTTDLLSVVMLMPSSFCYRCPLSVYIAENTRNMSLLCKCLYFSKSFLYGCPGYCHSLDENIKAGDDHLWAVGFRDGNHALEQILLSIESLQSRITNAKAHLSQVISINAGDLALGYSFAGDPPVSSTQSPSYSPRNNGHRMPVEVGKTSPYHGSDYEAEDMGLPGSAVSSFGDAPDLDIIESTMGLLSGADGPLNPNQMQDLCKDNSDDVLIHNQAADEELQNFEVSHVRDKPMKLATTKESNSDDCSTALALPVPPPQVISSAAAEVERGDSPSHQQALRPCYNGKKRGRKPKRRRRSVSSTRLKIERLQKKRRLSG